MVRRHLIIKDGTSERFEHRRLSRSRMMTSPRLARIRPLPPSTWVVRKAEWDLVRGTQQGQRPCAPRRQAGHKTVSDQCANHLKKVLLCRGHPHKTLSNALYVRQSSDAERLGECLLSAGFFVVHPVQQRNPLFSPCSSETAGLHLSGVEP